MRIQREVAELFPSGTQEWAAPVAEAGPARFRALRPVGPPRMERNLGGRIGRHQAVDVAIAMRSAANANDRSGISKLFANVANATSRAAGRASTFMVAAAVVVAWGVTGPMFNFSDT